MRKTLGWTVFFTAFTASLLRSKQPVMLLRRKPALHPSGRPTTLHSEVRHKKNPAAQSGFTPLCYISKGKVLSEILLFSSIKWREGKGEAAQLWRPAALASCSKFG